MANDDEPRHAFRAGRVVSALVVIAIGAVFLARNFGVELAFLNDTNWWAWIILVAAAWPLADAVARYRQVGRVDGEVWHALLSVLAIVLVSLFFILRLDWARWWPLFMMLGGLYMLGGRRRARERGDR